MYGVSGGCFTYLGNVEFETGPVAHDLDGLRRRGRVLQMPHTLLEACSFLAHFAAHCVVPAEGRVKI
jgi:hypothetical protein